MSNAFKEIFASIPNNNPSVITKRRSYNEVESCEQFYLESIHQSNRDLILSLLKHSFPHTPYSLPFGYNANSSGLQVLGNFYILGHGRYPYGTDIETLENLLLKKYPKQTVSVGRISTTNYTTFVQYCNCTKLVQKYVASTYGPDECGFDSHPHFRWSQAP